jgi:hypothetical protein
MSGLFGVLAAGAVAVCAVSARREWQAGRRRSAAWRVAVAIPYLLAAVVLLGMAAMNGSLP